MAGFMSIFVKYNGRWVNNKHKIQILSKIAESYENMQSALRHEPPRRIPVVLWYTRGPLGLAEGAKNIKQYYMDPDVKLSTQLLPLEKFPGLLVVPGVYHDLGLATEPSGFGCSIRWDEDTPPHPEPCLEDLSLVSARKAHDPYRDGLFPQAIEHYRQMLANLDPALVEAYPLLAGSTCILGPLEVAGYMYGHSRFYLGMVTEPDRIHELIAYVTEGIIRWLSILEEINGGHRIISLIEHTPSLISRSNSEEFFVPYVTKIRDAFPEAIFLYHNEGPSNHYLPLVAEIGADIFHCGDVELQEAKKQIGDRVTLMGTVHPLYVLRDGSREEVIKESKKCIESASEGGGFLLSSGGGLAMPVGATPWVNISAMLESV
ncbi:MAG: hypothetical protein JRI22_02995 [Deltaproteobacteria bacterium]|nr:hypothetical protein [Deltaproteobacteria bacterium]